MKLIIYGLKLGKRPTYNEKNRHGMTTIHDMAWLFKKSP
jgi:hypothetical protein